MKPKEQKTMRKQKRDYKVAKAIFITSIVWIILGGLAIAGYQYGEYRAAAGRLQGLQDAKSICQPTVK